MVNYASSNRLTVDLIPPEIIDMRRTGRRSLDFESPEEAEKRLIRHLLSLKFRKNKIAEQLNMSRANFYRKLKKYGLLELNDR
jgi:transcriptional regulator of acetoin/glycerol metabolism